jgi:hypothetical protein
MNKKCILVSCTVPVILIRLQCNSNFQHRFSQKNQIPYFMKIYPVWAKLFCVYRQTSMTKLMVAFCNSCNAPNRKHNTKLYYKWNTVPECHFVVLFRKSVFMLYQHYKTNVVYNCLQFIYNNFTSLNGSLFLPVYPVIGRKKYLNLAQTTGNCTHSIDQYVLSKAMLITKTNSIYANKTQWT